MKTSELLKAAEAFLWDGTGDLTGRKRYLCTAIQEAAKAHGVWWARCTGVTDLITARIGGSFFYVTWAVVQGLLPADWRDNAAHWWPVIQANRLNWLRELQREFREKGD